jgi:hypothetical protein
MWKRTRRRWLIVLAGVLLVLLSGLLLLRDNRRISPENLERVQVGMSLADVETILGSPIEVGKIDGVVSFAKWSDGVHAAHVDFDRFGRATGHLYWEGTGNPFVRRARFLWIQAFGSKPPF